MIHKNWFVIGAMSGTSLDGLDLVYVKFNSDKAYNFEILQAETLKYSEYWKNTLLSAFDKSPDKLMDLSCNYGILLAEMINNFIIKNKIETVDFIASHGHTIFHKPKQGITLQIGDGAKIAKITGHKVVCDFRTQDVTFGGQGAPLVPIGDTLLFGKYDYCLNLGGFSNVSFDENGTRKAYDICPVNIVLNSLIKPLGFDFDDKGLIAKSGQIHKGLLAELNEIEFYKVSAPKSLGFEFVMEDIFPIFKHYNLCVADLLRTYTEHIAQQLASNLKPDKSILITGGGAYNTFLLNRFKILSKCKLVAPKPELIEFKEALIFALLGLLRIENKINCLKSVTGANKDHSSGVVFLP